MKKFYLSFLPLLLAIISLGNLNAAPADGYYSAAEGKNQKALLTALCGIVGPHTTVSYNGLWSVYYDSDRRADGSIWDMYSTKAFKYKTDQCGSYSGIGDCYNREHSFPKSWFKEASPMVSDAYHIYPTDGKVNGQRSNYPYGECANGTYVSSSGSVKALGKLGSSTFAGYSGTVFEPDDQYKGDFARSYFYMAAAYNGKISGWNSPMLSGDNYPCFSSWAINLLLKWSREDPVSQKEIDRNEAVSKYQKNRNPFIDYPELAEYIWGNMKDHAWTPGGVKIPTIAQPTAGQVINMGVTSLNTPLNHQVTVRGANIAQDLTVSINNSAFTSAVSTVSAANVNAGTTITFSYTSAVATNATATVTLSSSETSVSFTLKAVSYDGIPALEATNVSTNAFTANWVQVGIVPVYKLSVFGSDGTTLIDGYPVDVTADAEQYDVVGLTESTDYYYSLTDGTISSNKIKVRTGDPIQVLTLFYDVNAFKMSALPNKASDPVTVKVYTENITDPITASVTGEFELSLDKTNWSSSLQINPEGETMYIRGKAKDTEGTYNGTLTVETANNPGEDADVTLTVSAPRTFFEDFETIPSGGYYSDVKKGSACSWTFKDVGCWGDANREGDLSARFGKSSTSSLTMAEDKFNGMGTVSFLAAKWKDDSDAEITLSYLNGSNWVPAKTWTISASTMNSYSQALNITGTSRIKIEQTKGGRLNIDDISISDYSAGVSSTLSDKWDTYAVAGGVKVEAEEGVDVIIYTTDAAKVYEGRIDSVNNFIPLEKGVYIVTLDNNRGRKVIVK